MADWPASLPCAFNLGSARRAPVQVYDEFQPDYSRPLRARKYTGQTWQVSGEADMTDAQLATLDTFFETTLHGGADRFNIENRMSFGMPLVAMFAGPYEISELTPKKYRVSMAFTMWDGSAGA